MRAPTSVGVVFVPQSRRVSVTCAGCADTLPRQQAMRTALSDSVFTIRFIGWSGDGLVKRTYAARRDTYSCMERPSRGTFRARGTVNGRLYKGRLVQCILMMLAIVTSACEQRQPAPLAGDYERSSV